MTNARATNSCLWRCPRALSSRGRSRSRPCSSKHSKIPKGGRSGPPILLPQNVIIFETAVRGASRPGLERFARRAQDLAGVRGEVSILIAGNRRLQQLNRRFRRKNKPTDVLSFPRVGGGDIAISAVIARQNARRYSHSAADEVKILVLHGMLHLAGYDHESDNGRMARLENKLRARLKLPASLLERVQPGVPGKPGFGLLGWQPGVPGKPGFGLLGWQPGVPGKPGFGLLGWQPGRERRRRR